jgi:hypothetical protein
MASSERLDGVTVQSQAEAAELFRQICLSAEERFWRAPVMAFADERAYMA